MTDRDYAAAIYCRIFNVPDDNGDAYARGILDLIETLDLREQDALGFRFRCGYSYNKIGDCIGGINAQKARYIVNKALRKLRHFSGEHAVSVAAIVNRSDTLLQEANDDIEKLFEQIERALRGEDLDPAIHEGLVSRRMKIGEIGVSPRVHRLLLEAGVRTVEALLSLESLETLMKSRGFGKKTRDELLKSMREHGHADWVDKMVYPSVESEFIY